MMYPKLSLGEPTRYSSCYGTQILYAELEEAIQLIPDCINGCYRAQTRLYKIFVKPMLQLCLKFTKGNLSKAQDIAQESFAKVYCHLHTLKSEKSLHVWITRIFYFEALESLRLSKRMKHQHHYFYLPITEDMPLLYFDLDFEHRHDLDTLLQQFASRHQNIFKLAANGYSIEDIGDELQMPSGTVKSIMSRERSKNRLHRTRYAGMF